MTQPWFDPPQFGIWYGVIGGGVGGTLMGLFGAAVGCLAPRGIGRRWVMLTMRALVVLGVIQLATGIAALVSGQPYGIWYPMVLCGGLMSLVIGGLIPVIRTRYAGAEQRRLDAHAIRGS